MISMRAFATAGAALALLAPTAVLARPKAPVSALAVSPAEAAQLREVARRGALLYAYDQAAWHGTDDMVAKLPDYQSRIGGWIVDGPAEAPELVFFDKGGARPVYVARFRDGKLVSGEVAGAGAAELSAPRRQLIAARAAALAALGESDSKGCSDAAMNSVVLPAAAPGEPTLVYILTPQRVMESFPFGGHYLIPVDASGRAGPIRRFTNTCLEISLSDLPKRGDSGITCGHPSPRQRANRDPCLYLPSGPSAGLGRHQRRSNMAGRRHRDPAHLQEGALSPTSPLGCRADAD